MSEAQEMRDVALLEAYLSEKLAQEEKKTVEDRLQSDESFIHLYETLRQLDAATRLTHLARKRDELLRLEEKIKAEHGTETSETPKKSKSPLRGRQWIAVAASILLAIGVWWMGRPTMEELMFVKQFEVYPMVDIVRGEVNQEEQIEEAYLAYANEDFRKAVRFFERIGLIEDENYYLYYGCALIKVGRIEEGKDIFDQMVEKWDDRRGIKLIE